MEGRRIKECKGSKEKCRKKGKFFSDKGRTLGRKTGRKEGRVC